MKLQYFGHSMWKIILSQSSIVIDPFDNIGYPLPANLSADAVVISHEHHDHNNVSLVQGNPRIIRKAGEYQSDDFSLELIPTFHDEEAGKKRGINHMIVIQADGLKLVHCGDLGHLPKKDILEHLGRPDLLMVPVGEVYTLPLSSVKTLVSNLDPILFFPMHYKTPAIGFKLGELPAFLKQSPGYMVYNESILDIDPELLSQKRTILMQPPLKER